LVTLEVDFGSYTVFINKDGRRIPLPLTLSEFRILAYMIRHPTQAFARADILDACLPESDALVRTVDTHISNLRRKLEEMGQTGFFPAVRGIGYRFFGSKMKIPRVPRLPLATLTAIVTTIMLLLSVGLTYLGVDRYATYLEQGITDSLPPKAAAAYKMLSDNKVPDGDSLRLLVENLIALNEPTDLKVQLSVLVFGLLSALLCALIGIFLARRLTRPLEELTFAAEGLKSGDFSVRVAAHYRSTREVSSLVETFNALATGLETMEERLRFNNMAVAHELRTPLTILQGSLQSMLDGVFPMDRKIISDLLLQVEGPCSGRRGSAHPVARHRPKAGDGTAAHRRIATGRERHRFGKADAGGKQAQGRDAAAACLDLGGFSPYPTSAAGAP
jgi:DNA-binding winged helix-turn-helix (wHTH) protein/HAMP domain-containing protein